jgi:hydrogenase maturation protein HypF
MKKIRIHIAIRGAVQGVGFRPFVYRIAVESKLNGYVLNNSAGVFIEAEGEEKTIRSFLFRIENEKPPLSIISSMEHSFLDPVDYNDFIIKESEESDEISAMILPDIAVCDDCLNEMFDPKDRRYLYPFINCTNCGPRFSIIESLPYDRPNTSMKTFEICEHCKEEYEDPMNRRFHAQPIACPDCGPQLALWVEKGNIISNKEEALNHTAKLIKEGEVIALKGLGGFQLIVDASNDEAIMEIRKRKHRDEKPFALMFPDLESIKLICDVSLAEQRVLTSPESPIVLLRKKIINNNSLFGIQNSVAPNNPYLGVMLPYTPLHHLLMKKLNVPIVATSANLSEEPICIDEIEALERLKGITDYFLVNNRPIVRHVDDSIVRIMKGREMVIRRARGYAPLPVQLTDKQNNLNDKTILAVGGHLKNSIALRVKNNVFISQHIGDLSTEEANKTFKKVINDFKTLYEVNPDTIICDNHPEYISTKYATSLSDNVNTVQHHYAHIAACRLENQIVGEAFGVSWDGTGYGLDGTIRGGEFFLSDESSYKHIGQFKQFSLPGGEIAIKEPRRSLAGLLFEISGEKFDEEYADILSTHFSSKELSLIKNMLIKKINSPITSSAGRLFDGVSALLNICSRSSYEGQAAMMLEFAADNNENGSYSFEITNGKKFVINWHSTIKEIITDIRSKIESSKIGAKFQNTLALIILNAAEKTQREKVILSGGCFQNVYLTERTIDLLQSKRFMVYWHQRVPPNDGGLSLGQIAAYILSNENQKEFKNDKLIKEVK